MTTQVSVTREARAQLKWCKILSGKDSYSAVIEHLIEEAGYEVPEEEFAEDNVKKVMFGEAGD